MILDQEFIDDIQIGGLSPIDSFKKHFANECEDKTDEEIRELANKRLRTKKNQEYYNLRVQEIEKQEREKFDWNTEIANKRIGRMIDFLETEVYEKGNQKMAVLSTLKELYKEKDLINGIQNHKITVNINPMQNAITENKLKTIDENGNIIDGEYKEVENAKE